MNNGVLQSIIIALSISPFLIFFKTKKLIHFLTIALIAVVTHGIYLFGWQIVMLFMIVYIISTVAEVISLKNYFNFFGITYKYNLKHKLFSSNINLFCVYPLEVSFAWVILKYISFAMSLLIVTAFSLPTYVLILITPLILVSLDFIIDPISVNYSKLWKWYKKGIYFGVPYQNFVGWYAVGLISSTLFHFFGYFQIVKFNILYVLPILLYLSVLKNAKLLFKINKKMALLGVFPVIFWSLLSLISLILIS